MEVKFTRDFKDWLNEQSLKLQQQINARVQRIELHNHLGDFKYLGEGLSELRFNNGTRIYFYRDGLEIIFIVLGGNKNGQKKDIKRAKAFKI